MDMSAVMILLVSRPDDRPVTEETGAAIAHSLEGERGGGGGASGASPGGGRGWGGGAMREAGPETGPAGVVVWSFGFGGRESWFAPPAPAPTWKARAAPLAL